jgi:hypothetical protein
MDNSIRILAIVAVSEKAAFMLHRWEGEAGRRAGSRLILHCMQNSPIACPATDWVYGSTPGRSTRKIKC